MVQTNKTSAAGKRATGKELPPRGTWLANIGESIVKVSKAQPSGLFARISPERKRYLDSLCLRTKSSISFTIDNMLTQMRKESRQRTQVPMWLTRALRLYEEKDYGTPLPFYTRVSTENKKYLELLSQKSMYSLSIILEVILWEVERNDSQAH